MGCYWPEGERDRRFERACCSYGGKEMKKCKLCGNYSCSCNIKDVRKVVSELLEKPTIVCLCGSTRFKDAFDEANYQETMAGKIVLSVGFFMHASGNKHGEGIGATPKQKIALDELHKRKIDLADEVLILNVGGYIGSSTRSELDYAIDAKKVIRFLEPITLPSEEKK